MTEFFHTIYIVLECLILNLKLISILKLSKSSSIGIRQAFASLSYLMSRYSTYQISFSQHLYYQNFLSSLKFGVKIRMLKSGQVNELEKKWGRSLTYCPMILITNFHIPCINNIKFISVLFYFYTK